MRWDGRFGKSAEEEEKDVKVLGHNQKVALNEEAVKLKGTRSNFPPACSDPWSLIFLCMRVTCLCVLYLQAGQMNVFDNTVVSRQHRLL